MHFIVDAHLDLAYNALSFGRNYARPAMATRELEKGSPVVARNGNTLLGLADFLLGHVGVIFGTLYAAPKRFRTGDWETLFYADANEAHKQYAKQLDYYARLADEHEAFRLIGSQQDLEAVLSTWRALCR